MSRNKYHAATVTCEECKESERVEDVTRRTHFDRPGDCKCVTINRRIERHFT